MEKVQDYDVILAKIEKELKKARERVIQLGEDMENLLSLAYQSKQNHDEEIRGLRNELNTVEESMSRQSKEFEAERGHCYELLN